MMWAGSICQGPGEQELDVLRWDAYANLTLQRPHLTSAGKMLTGVCESVSGWWDRERAKERTNQRKEEWISAEDEHRVEIGKSVLAFDLPKIQISLNQGCQIRSSFSEEDFCHLRFVLDSRLHAHSLCQPSASLFRLTDESHLQPEDTSEICAICFTRNMLLLYGHLGFLNT